MNNLARLEHVKSDEAGVAGTTGLDLTLGRAIEEVSREFESETGRSFVARLGTRYLRRHPRACQDELALEDDLATISGVTVDYDGDGTYELTLVENTDYFVERADDLESNTPVVLLRLNPNGTQLSAWPTASRAVKIVGLWGYSYERQDTGLNTDEELDASETEITCGALADTLVFPGDVAVIDSEQFDVTAVLGNKLTVTRGINGTTAATHTTGADIYIRRYPRDIEEVVRERAVGKRWDAQNGYEAQVPLTGDMKGAAGSTSVRASYARWRSTVRRYKNWGVA